MSQVQIIDQNEIKAIASGLAVSFNVPVYNTIDDILLTFTNNGVPATTVNMISSIGNVSLTLNGEQVVNAPLADILAFYKYLGSEIEYSDSAAGNVISLNAARLIFKNPIFENYFSFGGENITSLQVQVYCGTVTDITDVQLTTIRRDFKSLTKSYIKMINYPQKAAAVGISTVDTLPRDSNDAYLAVLAFQGVDGAIASGECVRNNMNIFEKTAISTANWVAGTRGRNVDGSFYPYDFSTGASNSFLYMGGCTELRFKTEFSTAPTTGSYDMLGISIRNVPPDMLAGNQV